MSELIDEQFERSAQARAELAAGLGVPHEKARIWLMRIAREEPKLEPPG